MTNAQELAPLPPPIAKPDDPFASDLFRPDSDFITVVELERPANNDEVKVEEEEPKTPAWFDSLPKVPQKTWESSSTLKKIPEDLLDRLLLSISAALRKIVFTEGENFSCSPASIAECDVLSEIERFVKAEDAALHIIAEPGRSDAVVFIGDGLISAIIDSLFGPSGYRSPGQYSQIESSILEFIAAKVVAKINSDLGNVTFLIGGITPSPKEFFVEHERGALACIDIRMDTATYSLNVLLSERSLSGLANSEQKTGRVKAANLVRSLPKIQLRATIGSTRLDAGSLAFLEPDDIVLLEESVLDWNHGSPNGTLQFFAGAGTGLRLTGTIKGNKNRGSDGMSIVVNEIYGAESAGVRPKLGSIMDDKKAENLNAGFDNADRVDGPDAAESEGLAASLENLQVRIRVELAGNTMSLRELNELREGQILDLGRGPSDPVTLITDGGEEAVATGELVDIDGRLGVRLTKILL